jgi:hypothetical protein
MRRSLLTLVLFGVAVAGVALAPSKAEGHGWRAGYSGYYPSYYYSSYYYPSYFSGYYPYATSYYYSVPATTSYYYTPGYSSYYYAPAYGYGGYGYSGYGYGGYGYRYNPGGLGGPYSGLGVRPGLGLGGFGLGR